MRLQALDFEIRVSSQAGKERFPQPVREAPTVIP
jgi:hypothetical protein